MAIAGYGVQNGITKTTVQASPPGQTLYSTDGPYCKQTDCGTIVYFGNTESTPNGCTSGLEELKKNVSFCNSFASGGKSCKCSKPSSFKSASWAASNNAFGAIEFDNLLTGKYTIYGPNDFTSASDLEVNNFDKYVNVTSTYSPIDSISAESSNIFRYQIAIDAAFIQKNLELSIQFFPQFAYEKVNVGNLSFIPFYTVMLLGYALVSITTEMSKESREELRHGLYMIGLDPIVYWLSWMRIMAFRYLFTWIPLIAVFKLLILPSLDFFLLIVILLIGTTWFMLYAILLAIAGVKPTLVNVFLVVIPMIIGATSYLYSTYLVSSSYQMPVPGWGSTLMAYFLGAPFGTSLLFVIALYYEGSGNPFGFAELGNDTPFLVSGSDIIVGMAVSTCLLGLLDYYLIMKTTGITTNSSENIVGEDVKNQIFSDVEDPKESRGKVAVSIKNLKKYFTRTNGTVNRAVDGLSVDFHEDQITSFLGHNGAGKSTTISLLTGLLSADSGDAIVKGYSIVNQMAEVRKIIGVCPQKNILWGLLSVKDHMKLFSRIRGVPDSIAKQDIDIVFLDEPTAGMDSSARRDLWEVLLKRKKGKCIILCTHAMDEADILGDLVAIVSSGKIQATGTPASLKSQYGKGHCQGVQLDLKNGDIRCIIPFSHDNDFAKVLKALEDKRKDGNFVEDFGIHSTSLEDVFWELGKQAEKESGNSTSPAKIPDDNFQLEIPFGFKMLPILLERDFIDFQRTLVQNLLNAVPLIIFFSIRLKVLWDGFNQQPSLPKLVNVTGISPCLCSGDDAHVSKIDVPNQNSYSTYTILTNQTVTYAPYGLISFANNGIYGKTNSLSISYYSWPEVSTPMDEFMIKYRVNFIMTQIGSMFFCFAVVYVGARTSQKVVHNTANNVKQMQLLMGVSLVEYHISQVVWDLFNALIVILLPMIVLFALNGRTAEGSFILLILLYFLCIFPLVYMLSSLFDDESTVYSILANVGMYTFFGVSLLYLFLDASNLGKEPSAYYYVFLLHPVFALQQGIQGMSWAKLFEYNPLLMKSPPSTWPCIYLFLEILVFYSLFFHLEYKKLSADDEDYIPLIDSLSPQDIEDDEVAIERQEIHAELKNNYGDGSFEMVSLGRNIKTDADQQFHGTVAVKDLALRVRKSECLSFLGSNGAGKTSVMNILLRQQFATSGSIFYKGEPLSSLTDETARTMSYCPQQNALFENLTTQELDDVSQQWLHACDLDKHAKTLTKDLSGGNKRKLNLAIALVGNPGFVVLDEPSAGVDPAARRKLHSIINHVKRKGSTICLTTHHMEEASSLVCLGSVQHLISKYGKGYLVTACMNEGYPYEENLLPFVREICPEANVAMSSGKLYCSIELGKKVNFSIAQLYRTLLNLQTEKKIDYFNIGQSRLEDVFLILTEKLLRNNETTTAVNDTQDTQADHHSL
eukprot:GSChrysophyteH1.ASY1.ANO1.3102.1 assembled CDS